MHAGPIQLSCQTRYTPEGYNKSKDFMTPTEAIPRNQYLKN